MTETIFSKIINKEAEADIVYEDDEMIAFKDIRPKAPVHILVVPKKPIPDLNAFTAEDTELLGKLMLKAKDIAKEFGIAESGYKVITNTGDDAGQIIHHFHLHVVGGEPIKTVV
ncbi:MAG: histidine triad nucleotide-binding protein [Candidatus Kerfeldbacteria bacterium]